MPAALGANKQRNGQYPPTVKVTENQIETELLRHFGFDVNNAADLTRVKELLNTAGSPFAELKTTGNFTVAYNNRTGKYEANDFVEKNLFLRLQGKASEIKQQIKNEKEQPATVNRTNPNDVIAAKNGITNDRRTDLENKLQNNTPSVSAPNESQQAVRNITDTIAKVTGTTDWENANPVGAQFNRLGVSALRLSGKALELSNYFNERIDDAIRYVAPDSVDELLNQTDKINRENAQALQNASSAVTSEDTFVDARAAQLGQEIPVTEDLANKAMYFPEGIPNAVDSAVKGDFKDDDGSYSDKVGKIVGGLVPGVSDARDLIADGKRVSNGENGAYLKFGATMLGAIPIIGDVGKGIIKAEEKAIVKGLEKTVVKDSEKITEKESSKFVEKEIKQTVETEEIKNIPKTKISEYKEVEIVDKMGNPIGEFDRIEKNSFVEDKSAKGLSTLNPKTGKPIQTAEQWAEKQIYEKSVVRIENLENKAVSTRATKNGSQVVPALDEIKNIRKLKFKVKGDSTELRKAVEEQIKKLSQKYPDWKFSAEFGV